jgi:hypothetical protein
MASFEFLDPKTDDSLVHLKFLLPYIRAFRHKHGPLKRCYDFGVYPGEYEGKEATLDRFDFIRKEFNEDRFFNYVSVNLDQILDECNFRWALSILMCYVDGHPSRDIRLQALCLSNLIRFDTFHLSFVDNSKISNREYTVNNEKYSQHGSFYLKNKQHKKIPIKYLDGFWNNSGGTDSLQLIYLRAEELVTDKDLLKLFYFCVNKLVNHWGSLFKLGIKASSLPDVMDRVEDYRQKRDKNIELWNNIDWGEVDG